MIGQLFSTTPASGVSKVALFESANKAMNEPVNGSREEAASSSWQNSTFSADHMDHSASNSSSGSPTSAPYSSTSAETPPGMKRTVKLSNEVLTDFYLKTFKPMVKRIYWSDNVSRANLYMYYM